MRLDNEWQVQAGINAVLAKECAELAMQSTGQGLVELFERWQSVASSSAPMPLEPFGFEDVGQAGRTGQEEQRVRQERQPDVRSEEHTSELQSH